MKLTYGQLSTIVYQICEDNSIDDTEELVDYLGENEELYVLVLNEEKETDDSISNLDKEISILESEIKIDLETMKGE